MAEISTTVKEFELTYVVYNIHDPLGGIFALITLSPIFIMVMYAVLIVFQRDLDSIALLIGQLLNEVINQILKRTFKQKRPTLSKLSGSGMPSAHSQFIAFFSIYVIFYTYKRINVKRKIEQWATILGAAILAVLVCISRIWLHYHTYHQVFVGFIAGTILGTTWFYLIDKISPRLFPYIANHPIAQYLYIRDISAIPDLIVYQHHQSISQLHTKVE